VTLFDEIPCFSAEGFDTEKAVLTIARQFENGLARDRRRFIENEDAGSH
jgi:hypothetical protein